MSIPQLRADARDLLRRADRNPWLVTAQFLLIVYLLLICYNVFSLWYSYFVDAAPGGLSAREKVGRYYTYATVAPIVIMFLSNAVYGAYTGYTVALTKDPGADLGTLLGCLRQFGKLLFLTVLISFFTFLWTCLLIIPGIVAIYRYRLSYQVLFDHPEYSAVQALEASKQLTYGHKLELFQQDVSFFYYYLLTMGGNVVMNIPVYYELPNPGLAADLRFFFLGTALVLIGELLFLPHLRMSQTEAYFAIQAAEAPQVFPSNDLPPSAGPD